MLAFDWFWQQSDTCIANQNFKIVVIGSSTAAGTGPSSVDSAWVWRYRSYLESININNEVINLAQGGYTTNHLMPTGFSWQSSNGTISYADSTKNISKALSLNPDGIIVNLPSNDAAYSYAINYTMSNFDTIFNRAKEKSIPIWICTTQPRNFSWNPQILLQTSCRDSIISRYGNFAIDFWSTIADTNNWIDSQYDCGDGIHLNDAGHAVLYNRVKQSSVLEEIVKGKIPKVFLGNDTSVISTILDAGYNSSSYLWSDGSVSQYLQLPNNVYNGNSWHTISVIVTDSNSCINSDTIKVNFISSTHMVEYFYSKKIINEIDFLGRETKKKKNQPYIYIYDDGTVEKRIIIE